MPEIRVHISDQVVLDFLVTGKVHRRTVVSKGLPSDARLIGAMVHSRPTRLDELELIFESERAAEDGVATIELVTITDAVHTCLNSEEQDWISQNLKRCEYCGHLLIFHDHLGNCMVSESYCKSTHCRKEE